MAPIYDLPPGVQTPAEIARSIVSDYTPRPMTLDMAAGRPAETTDLASQFQVGGRNLLVTREALRDPILALWAQSEAKRLGLGIQITD